MLPGKTLAVDRRRIPGVVQAEEHATKSCRLIGSLREDFRRISACCGDAAPQTERHRFSLLLAKDDAQSALELAKRSGYAWAARDALHLLADICSAMGDPRSRDAHRRLASDLDGQLRITSRGAGRWSRTIDWSTNQKAQDAQFQSFGSRPFSAFGPATPKSIVREWLRSMARVHDRCLPDSGAGRLPFAARFGLPRQTCSSEAISQGIMSRPIRLSFLIISREDAHAP